MTVIKQVRILKFVYINRACVNFYGWVVCRLCHGRVEEIKNAYKYKPMYTKNAHLCNISSLCVGRQFSTECHDHFAQAKWSLPSLALTVTELGSGEQSNLLGFAYS